MSEPQHQVSEYFRLGRRIEHRVNIHLADIASAQVPVRLRDKIIRSAGVVRCFRGKGGGRRDRKIASATGNRNDRRCECDKKEEAKAARCLQHIEASPQVRPKVILEGILFREGLQSTLRMALSFVASGSGGSYIALQTMVISTFVFGNARAGLIRGIRGEESYLADLAVVENADDDHPANNVSGGRGQQPENVGANGYLSHQNRGNNFAAGDNAMRELADAHYKSQ
jgi:hypothetical protein